MSKELRIFDYEGASIRTVEIDGVAWFVAKDVCNVLEMTTETTRRLDKDEKGLTKIQTPSGMQDMTVINEFGMYALILRSNKPEAKQFQRWVIHEVLPQIHRSGVYLSEQAAEAYKNNPELFREMVERCTNPEQKVSEMEKRLNREHPYSVFGHVMLANQGAISFKDAASFLCQRGIAIGQNRLFKHCRDKKLLCSRKGRQWNKPTQKALEAGLLNVEISGNFNTITVITPQGMKHITDELMAEQFPLIALLDGQEDA